MLRLTVCSKARDAIYRAKRRGISFDSTADKQQGFTL